MGSICANFRKDLIEQCVSHEWRMLRPLFDRTEHTKGIAQLDSLDCKEIRERWHYQRYRIMLWVIHFHSHTFQNSGALRKQQFQQPQNHVVGGKVYTLDQSP